MILYDRTARRLDTPHRRARLHARALQAVHKGLKPVGYLGVSRLFTLVNRLAPAVDPETMVCEGAFRFSFPSDDYYWNRLLDSHWRYEPEIDGLLASIRTRPWLFVDLGANFGYWSARVVALYGPRRVIAVEPAAASHEVLARNVEPFGESVRKVRRAVWHRTGADVSLYGSRHPGLSLDPHWLGASPFAGERVETITLDDLLRESGEDPAVLPVVVKLDVEGVEAEVLAGGRETAAGKSLFLLEDASPAGQVGQAVRDACALGMRLYALDGAGRVRRLARPEEVLRLKGWRTRIQQTGLNLVVTGSALWWEILEGGS
jgi:FkbM family methyltransferase